MYEHMTTERILSDILSQAPEGIDTRPGSIFYDSVKGISLVISRAYADIDITTLLVSLDTTGGEYLDRKGAEHGLIRNPAKSAVYAFTYTGETPVVGSRFFYDGLYFTLALDDSNNLCLIADAPGEASNYIESGTAAFPVDSLPGLLTSSFGAISVYGVDTESDDAFRERLRWKIAGPAENGNKAHYKAWCEEVDGVGRAKIIPLWNGPNTVKGILISPSGTGVSSNVIAAVQKHIDPNDLEVTVTVNGVTYNVGDGLGEGVANIGAHFTAASATEQSVNVTIAGLSAASGYSIDDAKAAISPALTAWLKNHALTASDEDSSQIYASALGFEIMALPSVGQYNTIKLNTNQDSVEVAADKVAVLGTVTYSD